MHLDAPSLELAGVVREKQHHEEAIPPVLCALWLRHRRVPLVRPERQK